MNVWSTRDESLSTAGFIICNLFVLIFFSKNNALCSETNVILHYDCMYKKTSFVFDSTTTLTSFFFKKIAFASLTAWSTLLEAAKEMAGIVYIYD